MTGNSLIQLTIGHAQSSELAKAYRYNSRRATICVAAGATLAAAGVFTALVGAIASDVPSASRHPYYIAGASAFVAGTALLTIPLPIFGSRALHYRNGALNRYNEGDGPQL